MTDKIILNTGDSSENGQITIVDQDRLCYLVQSSSKGATGMRTISKALVREYIDFFSKNPNATSSEARDFLTGGSNIDKFEYGYTSTLRVMALMALANQEPTSSDVSEAPIPLKHDNPFRPYITAIRTKPFMLLAGISGTGKSRIVRELARACFSEDSADYTAHKPKNFEMIQVKPNWHDSSEFIGYVSRVSGTPEFVAGDFLKFVVKAWEDPKTPYFLCLDEMNLAPVEQYFAEYLSVIESRKSNNGVVTTDPILKMEVQEWYHDLVCTLTEEENLQQQFLSDGISIPQNLIVVGTVNMDETTFSFSRKVLDRAMTIEMNEVDLHGGLDKKYETIGKIDFNTIVGNFVEGVDVYSDNQEICDSVLDYLGKVNEVLDKTPFKVAYRTRNEFLLYVVNNLCYNKDEDGNDMDQNYVIARAVDEITSMKILSRIEGDETKTTKVIDGLKRVVDQQLKNIYAEFESETSVSLNKLNEMQARLTFGYTSFWS